MRQPSKSTKIDAYNYKRDLSLQPLTLWGCSCHLLSCLVPSGAQGTSGNSASSWSLPRSCPSQWCIQTSRPQWRQWLDTPQQFCFNQTKHHQSIQYQIMLTGWKFNVHKMLYTFMVVRLQKFLWPKFPTVNRVIFAQCNFRPSTIANSFTPS